jgi:glycosyltransferase involved in cell wall biosynthesis
VNKPPILSDKGNILFIQDRSIRAGAQTSLERMVQSENIRQLNPAALIAQPGWLSDTLKKHHVPAVVSRWPSPRSLKARLGGLDRFAKKIVPVLKQASIYPRVIIANDHQECLLAHSLSRALGGVPLMAILRTPGMNQLDFEKYRCAHCDVVFGEGHELRKRVETWLKKPVPLFEEGFAESEFLAPKSLPEQFPKRIFVAGSEEPRKGFQDFFDALEILEKKQPDFLGFDCHLTGAPPEDEATQRFLENSLRSELTFLGRVDNFIETASAFDLAIHPSRAESFGMAPLELLLAGIPTLISTTGVVEKMDIPEEWQFTPNDPGDLADHLEKLWLKWPEVSPAVSNIQKQIREQYHIEQTTAGVANEAHRLMS